MLMHYFFQWNELNIKNGEESLTKRDLQLIDRNNLYGVMINRSYTWNFIIKEFIFIRFANANK